MDLQELAGNVIIQATKEELFDAFTEAIKQDRENTEKIWLTVSELSEYMGYKKTTIYKYIHDGKLPYYKTNGKVMFLKSEVDQMMSSGSNPI